MVILLQHNHKKNMYVITLQTSIFNLLVKKNILRDVNIFLNNQLF